LQVWSSAYKGERNHKRIVGKNGVRVKCQSKQQGVDEMLGEMDQNTQRKW